LVLLVLKPLVETYMWRFESKTTGLPTIPSQTGTWIMWADTPYARLMINQNPIPAGAGAAERK
jgi:hypothetical protein